VALAANQPGPWGIALDADFVYWTHGNGGGVSKVAKNGGAPIPLVGDKLTMSQGQGVAVDATSVYWTNTNGSVFKLTPK
jgi:hypothetical protein